jgi:uncharacterized phage protein (TIGR02220 family)
MGAAVRLEPNVWTDARFTLLAQQVGIDRDAAVAKVARLWSECTSQQSYHLTAKIIDAVSGLQNFHVALIESDLGRDEKGVIYVCGTRGRIEWLKKLRKSSKKGGASNRAKWLAKRKPNGSQMDSQTGAKAEPKPSPLSLTLTLAPSLVTSPEEEREESARSACSRWLGYLAENTGRAAPKLTDERVKAFRRILSESWTENDLKVVVWSKCHGPRKWLGDPKMDEHLTPETLLRKAHLAKYVEQGRREFAEHNPEKAREYGWIQEATA